MSGLDLVFYITYLKKIKFLSVRGYMSLLVLENKPVKILSKYPWRTSFG